MRLASTGLYVTGEENGYFFSGPSVAMDGKDGIDI